MKPLTPKQEKFCQEYVTTSNASEAYRRSYNCEKSKDSTIHRKAKELMDNGKIQARIEEIKGEHAAKHHKTREDIISDLTDIINEYKMTGRHTGHTLKAIEIMNKMNGWNEAEKSEVTHKGITLNIIKPSQKD